MMLMRAPGKCGKPMPMDCTNQCEAPGPRNTEDTLARAVGAMVPSKKKKEMECHCPIGQANLQEPEKKTDKQLECLTGKKQECSEMSRKTAEIALISLLAEQTKDITEMKPDCQLFEQSCQKNHQQKQFDTQLNQLKNLFQAMPVPQKQKCEPAISQEIQQVLKPPTSACEIACQGRTSSMPNISMPQSGSASMNMGSSTECIKQLPTSFNLPIQSVTETMPNECVQQQPVSFTSPSEGGTESMPAECEPSQSNPPVQSNPTQSTQNDCVSSQMNPTTVLVSVQPTPTEFVPTNQNPSLPSGTNSPPTECILSQPSRVQPQTQPDCTLSTQSVTQSPTSVQTVPECVPTTQTIQECPLEAPNVPESQPPSPPETNPNLDSEWIENNPMKKSGTPQRLRESPQTTRAEPLQQPQTDCLPADLRQEPQTTPQPCVTNIMPSQTPTFPEVKSESQVTSVELPVEQQPVPCEPNPQSETRIDPVKLIRKTMEKLASHRYKPSSAPPIHKKVQTKPQPQQQIPVLEGLSRMQKMCCGSHGECPCMPVINIYPIIER